MQHFHDAPEAGSSSPESDEAPGLAGGGSSEGQGTADNQDCAAAAALRKRIATAQARAALIGLRLDALNDGAWSLTYSAFGSAGRICIVPSLQAALPG